MASALTLKSGATLTIKSGATLTIKDSGGGSYIVPGLEQSHWLASDAVVSAGRATTIPDTSGEGSDALISTGIGPSYNVNGWVSGSKTLPTISFLGGYPMSAQNWAGRLNNYAGAWTIAMLINLSDNASGRRPVFTLEGTTGVAWQSHYGPMTVGSDGNILRMGRTPEEWTNNSNLRFPKYLQGSPKTDVNQLWVIEYPGIAVATALGQYRWWVNGAEAPLDLANYPIASAGNGGRQAMPVTAVSFGGQQIYPASASMAQAD